ncbi:MAG: Bax inhibitor-1 family protein, partial [Xanthobacteraceae bacterium]
MSDFDRNYATPRTGYRTDQVTIDAGLRAYMIRVYNYMAAGVALTGVVAWLAYQAAGGDAIQVAGGHITGLTTFGQAIFGGPLMWVFILAPLGLVFLISFGINRFSAGTALGLFFLYAGLLGLSLASIFLAYTGQSITQVFFISAATFGAM